MTLSFSSDVKDELLLNVENTGDVHCKIAELLAVINICGAVSTNSYDSYIAVHSDNKRLTLLCASLVKYLFNYDVKPSLNEIIIRDKKLIDNMIKTLGIGDSNSPQSPVKHRIVERNCCKRAYLRTAFICCGSINDPRKHYHIEFADNDSDHADVLMELARDFGVEMRTVKRKNHIVVYCKEAEQIADLLNVMSAYRSLLEYENLRIVKDVRNNINRIVNCETANINKVVASSLRQIEDINVIIDKRGIDFLPDNLKAAALARLEFPDLSLKELGENMSPPVGKSGVNHRLKKIHEIAESLKGDY